MNTPSSIVEIDMLRHRNLPNSAIRVKALLLTVKELDLGEIVSATGLAPRTVRYALTKLKDAGLIQEKLNFRDMRKIIYSLKIPIEQ